METTTQDLNEAQREVVESTAKKKLVLAGPGSGKTRTLVAAVRRMVEPTSGAATVDASSVVVITYTNKAAVELIHRLGDAGRQLGYCGTFHGFMLRLLKEHGAVVGLPKSVSVIDDEQKESIVQTVMEELGLAKWSGDKFNPKVPLKEVMAALDNYHEVSPVSTDKAKLVAREYRTRMLRAGLLDFDMVLVKGRELVLRLHARGQWRYGALFWDEGQDMSDGDWAAMDGMPCDYKFVVGDPDQAIYGFRGGNVHNLLQAVQFAQDPKSARKGEWEVHELDANYRSAANICFYANNLIKHNAQRVPKQTLSSDAERAGVVVSGEAGNPAAELCYVMQGIQKRCGPPLSTATSYSGLAVLARTNWLAQQFAEFLKARGVPVAERKRRQDPPDWRKAKLLLTVLANPWNDLAAYHYIAAEYGREHANAAKAQAAAAMKSISEHSLGFLAANRDGTGEQSLSLAGLKVSAESRERIHDAYRALSARGPWGLNDLVAYLNSGEDMVEQEGEGVAVMTMHASKGLEFDTVFVVGCEEGLCPQARQDTDVEEERRLFYVAMTRAKSHLFLSWCRSRPQNRGQGRPPGPPEPRTASRFIAEAGL